MALDRSQIPTGLINGSNVLFAIDPYISGSLFLIINGLKRRPIDDDGVIETSPVAGTFTTKEVLVTGTKLVAEFLDTSSNFGSTVVGVVSATKVTAKVVVI
jgi:hypothetical protein